MLFGLLLCAWKGRLFMVRHLVAPPLTSFKCTETFASCYTCTSRLFSSSRTYTSTPTPTTSPSPSAPYPHLHPAVHLHTGPKPSHVHQHPEDPNPLWRKNQPQSALSEQLGVLPWVLPTTGPLKIVSLAPSLVNPKFRISNQT